MPPVTFDYPATHLWDLKTHSINRSSTLILNDCRAVETAIGEHDDIGLLVLHREAIFDSEHECWR